MCELFGISSQERISCDHLLRQFFNDAPNHPDGWGLAVWDGDNVSIEKEPLSAAMSMYLKSRLTDEIVTDTLIAHIRKASVGSINYKNTHPFVQCDASGRQWTLAHNGTVFESEILDAYKSQQKGQSDSERILLYLIDCINGRMKEKEEALNCAERFQVLDAVIRDITPKNKINLLIYDGELFYVHSNHPHSLHRRHLGDAVLFSTIPYEEEEWSMLPMNTLLAYRRDKLVYFGQSHDHTYRKENDPAEWYDSISDPDYFYI